MGGHVTKAAGRTGAAGAQYYNAENRQGAKSARKEGQAPIIDILDRSDSGDYLALAVTASGSKARPYKRGGGRG